MSSDRPHTALVFPGMAPISFADVGKFLILNPFAKDLVAATDRRLGGSLIGDLKSADGDYTHAAQLAFFVSCVALARWAEAELGVEPVAATGPSFGEKPLTAHVGALPFDDAVWLTAQLARVLDEFFATEHTDVVTHSFARVPRERVTELLGELAAAGGWSDVSCYVDTDFHMVSLRERDLEWLQRAIRANGGLSIYTMRPPMHSSAFGALRRKAEDEVIGRLEFADPVIPVIADQDGAVIRTADGVRAMLLDSFTTPLRWPAVVESLARNGVGRVCVAGPDSLFGRVSLTKSTFEVVAAAPQAAMRARRAAPVPS